MRRERVDWFGMAMRARAELGDSSLTRYGRVDARRRRIEWHAVDHAEADGVGGLARVLRRLGHRIAPLSGDHAPQPPWHRRWGHWRDYWRHVQHAPIRWRTALADTGGGLSDDPAWVLFTRDETRRIEIAALRVGASVNSFLLATLNRVIAQELIEPATDYRWMIPVNLRGALSLPDDTANHVSVLSLPARHDMTPREVQERLRDLTRRQHDWGFYWTIRFIGRVFGYRGMLAVTRRMGRESDKGLICGCLTNLGYWQASHPGLPEDPEDGWIVVPLVSRNNPVAAGAVTWNGRLSIALDIHSALQVAPQRIHALFSQWESAIRDHAIPGSRCMTHLAAA
jgi:hypothetical protein